MVARRRALVLALIAAVLAACSSASPSATASPTATPESTPASAEPTPISAAELAHAVVQVLMIVDEEIIGSGSGTIIDADGLILTNAHVATPSDIQLTDIQIAMTTTTDHAAEPTYRAEVAAADTVLDLALLQITETLDGGPVPDDLPFVTLGDSDVLDIGDDISILGYPGIGGDTITFTSGQVSGFTGDAVLGDRAWIKTDATIAGGNSGGLAANDNGEIIGIPTRSGTTSDIVDCRVIVDTNRDGVIDENDTCVPLGGFINGLRPIALAIDMIDAVQGGVAYEPIGGLPEPGPSTEPGGYDTSGVAFEPTVFSSGVDENDQPIDDVFWLPSGVTEVCANWLYEGMEAGMTWEAIWSVGGTVDEDFSFFQQTWALEPAGSFWVCVSNEDGLAPGVYDIALNIEGDFFRGGFVAIGDELAPVTLELLNQSELTICYLYASPIEAGSWGPDRLGEGVLEPGGSVSFEVPAGIYDVLAQTCDSDTLLDETDVDVTADTTLTYP